MNKLKDDGIVYLKADKDGIVTLTFVQAVEIVMRNKPFCINGQFYRAIVFGIKGSEPCEFCTLDCLCKKPVSSICTDLEFLMHEPIILKLMCDQ